MHHVVTVIVWATLLATGALADSIGFRGPGGTGVSYGTNLPTKWSETENIAWKSELPGRGSSSPIVVGNHIYLTYYDGYGQDIKQPGEMQNLERHILCLDRQTGKRVWDRKVESRLPEQAYERRLALHGYASSTPASDGSNLYVFFGKSGLFAMSLDGDSLWNTMVGERTNGWGSSNSPVALDDLVFVNASIESGSLVAIDTKSGTQKWSASRIQASWNTPIVADAASRKELVVNVKDRIRAFHPHTGAELWNCEGIADYVCPSLVSHDGVVYAIGGRSSTALAVRCGGSGDVTKSHVIWRINRGSNVSSPVYYRGHLYWVGDRTGVAHCVDAKTGKVVYEERLKPAPDLVYASPLVADGKLFVVSRERGAYVLNASPDFQLLAHNLLDASVFNASPLADGGQLLLRSDRYLYCIGK